MDPPEVEVRMDKESSADKAMARMRYYLNTYKI